MEMSETTWFIARLLACAIWIATVLYKLTHVRSFAAKLVRLGYTFMPLPSTYAAIVLELGGTVLILLDQFVWAVALAWIPFTAYSTWLEHRHIVAPDGALDVPQYMNVFKNVSIIGGLFALIVLDPAKPVWLVRTLGS